jgi:hypothetical protein
MPEQTKLEVAIPLEIATSRLVSRQFLTHVRRLMLHFDGQNVSGSSEGNRNFFLEAFFPDRKNAVGAVTAIRALSLGYSRKSAKDFWYTIDNDEMLFFKNKGDLYAYESKSFASVLEEKLGSKVSESFSDFVCS